MDNLARIETSRPWLHVAVACYMLGFWPFTWLGDLAVGWAIVVRHG